MGESSPPVNLLKFSEIEETTGGQVARVFRFVDRLGTELHIINDPLDKLPIPQIKELISIGQSQMLVESVALAQSSTPSLNYSRI
jgi:hypothetical protein